MVQKEIQSECKHKEYSLSCLGSEIQNRGMSYSLTDILRIKYFGLNIDSKNRFLRNQKTYDFETWHEASMREALQSLYKS